jgi:hypothetical protein
MTTFGELEAQQQNQQNAKARLNAGGRKKAALGGVGHAPAASTRRGSASSPRDDDVTDLHPDMTLDAAGLRRMSTASSPDQPQRRNSDVPDALRNLPGALAIASGTYVHGARVSSAPSAVQERRRSVQHAVTVAHVDPAVADRRRSSIALGAELAAMLQSGESGDGEGKSEA